MRKVHHPKIVQRADSRWMVVCQDCERDSDLRPPWESTLPSSRFFKRGKISPISRHTSVPPESPRQWVRINPTSL